jgi:hypothetical protein
VWPDKSGETPPGFVFSRDFCLLLGVGECLCCCVIVLVARGGREAGGAGVQGC